jgi:hypothetical protein
MSAAKARVTSALRGVSRLYEVPTSTARVFPDFVIIGAERAGTTSLYRYLGRHPQVIPATLRRKGAHYFDTNFDKSSRWYRSHFATRLAMSTAVRRAGSRRVITGEACPYYFFHPLVPERMRALLPDVRLILMLRDPVARAYSHYLHEVARGFEQLSFEDALDAESERLAGEEERIRAQPFHVSFAHQHFSYLARGHYAEQLVRWQVAFPRDQLLIVDSGDFFADPDKGFREVTRFLAIAEMSLPSYPQLNSRTDGHMSPATADRLKAHFEEPNRRLEDLVGRSFSWTA